MVVSLHNATTTPTGLELVYSVRVSGKLVPATTAAGDMRLLTDKEVTAELGYPLVTKAEREYPVQIVETADNDFKNICRYYVNLKRELFVNYQY